MCQAQHAELETRIPSMPQGPQAGLEWCSWAMERPQGSVVCLLCWHKATLSSESQTMYTQTSNLDTRMKIPNIPTLRIREVVVLIIAIKNSQHKLSRVRSTQQMQLKGQHTAICAVFLGIKAGLVSEGFSTATSSHHLFALCYNNFWAGNHALGTRWIQKSFTYSLKSGN